MPAFNRALISTCVRSSVNVAFSTTPTSTLRLLIRVFPFNPFSVGGDQRHLRPLMAVVIKRIHAPISTVTMGKIHTGDQFFTFCTFASPLLFSMLLHFLMA